MANRLRLVQEIADLKRQLDDRVRALSQWEARFEAIFNSAFTLLGLCTVDGIVIECNLAALQLIGAHREDVIGKAFWDTPWVNRTPAEQNRIKAAFARRGEFVRYEASVQLPDKQWRTFDFSLRPVFSADRAETQLLVLEARDLTDVRRAEDRLQQAQRMEALGLLTGGVAHDFNNLLTVIMGALDMAVRQPAKPNREALLKSALEAAHRAQDLNRQLLAFARRTPVAVEPVDLSSTLSDIEMLVRQAMGEAIEVRFDIDDDLGAVEMDRVQAEAALLNLAVNARDAMPSGGQFNVRARRATASEVHGLGLDGDFVVIEAADTGIGIAPEFIDRVFEPFFTTKALGRGTGLGLSQAYGFARQIGGRLDVVSKPGCGATFRLCLPRTTHAPAARPRRNAHTPPAPFDTVLVVEDDHAVAAVAQAMLADLGVDVSLAHDAVEAQKALSTKTFDLLLTDIIMPGGINGVELARWAKQRNPAMQILLSSGWTSDALSDDVLAAPWPTIQKPYDLEALSQAMNALSPAAGAHALRAPEAARRRQRRAHHVAATG